MTCPSLPSGKHWRSRLYVYLAAITCRAAAWFLLAWSPALAQGASPNGVATNSGVAELAPGAPVQGQLQGEETREWMIHAGAGQYVEPVLLEK